MRPRASSHSARETMRGWSCCPPAGVRERRRRASRTSRSSPNGDWPVPVGVGERVWIRVSSVAADRPNSRSPSSRARAACKIAGLVPRPGEDQAPRRLDLEILARDRALARRSPSPVSSPGAADARRAAVTCSSCRAGRTIGELLGIGPGREHALGRRVERADHDAACGRQERRLRPSLFAFW